MTTTDRLRIERAVWLLDYRLQDLPRRSRIAKRRELRENLQAATSDVGAQQALRQLGDLRDLAEDYLSAEYGDRARRPSWTATAVWLAATNLAALVLGYATSAAFAAGARATNPHLSETLHWHGVRYLISDATFTFVDGRSSSVGGAYTAWVYLLMFGGAIVAGRLWRLLPVGPTGRRRQADTTQARPGARRSVLRR
jgi:hypothetical protein